MRQELSARRSAELRHLLFANTVLAGLLLGSTSSSAGRAEACTAHLSVDAKLVYSVTIDSVAANVDFRELVRSKTRSLVMAGQLDRGSSGSRALDGLSRAET
jgi:hypothetical protein